MYPAYIRVSQKHETKTLVLGVSLPPLFKLYCVSSSSQSCLVLAHISSLRYSVTDGLVIVCLFRKTMLQYYKLIKRAVLCPVYLLSLKRTSVRACD